MDSTTGLTSEETSLSFVCDENFGSGTLTERTQVSPSLASSPTKLIFSFFCKPFLDTNEFIVLVNAALNPAKCVPPSLCGILFVNTKQFS